MASPWPRRIGMALAGLVVVVLILVAALVGLSSSKLTQRLAVTPATLTIPDDSAMLARGKHLTGPIGKCTDCHGEDLRGQVMDMGPLGQLTASNLTTGKGGLRGWTEADLVRAIRHGVRPDSSLLVFMPSAVYHELTEADLAATVAYLRSVPPVDNELPRSKVGPIGRVAAVTQTAKFIPALGIDHAAPFAAPVAPGPTAEYGRYLATVGGCTYCHRADLSGGLVEGPPGSPPSADLRASGPTARWTEADFAHTLRTGTRPDGSALNPAMPWRLAGQMTDEEISAVWAFMRR